MRKVVHSTGLIGIESLLNNDNAGRESYLCCSSIGCDKYFDREVMFLIEGEVLREFNGDIGCLELSDNPTNFGYDEIHIAGDYEVKALFIPNDRERFKLEDFRNAYHFITEILQETIEVVSESDDEEAIEFVRDWRHFEPENITDEEYIAIWNDRYNLDIPEDYLVG